MDYQVTLFCADGKYKPVSALVKMPSKVDLKDEKIKKEIQTKGIQKICIKRLWSNVDLKKYGYTRIKIREYDIEKINEENKKRYEEIKEKNYENGKWKRPTQQVLPSLLF